MAIYNDTLYVVDTKNSAILALNLDGDFLFEIGKEADLNNPVYVDVKKTIVVSDVMNFGVKEFTKQDSLLHSFGESGDLPGHFARPKGVGVDRLGNIYIADALQKNIQIYSPEHSLLYYWGFTFSEFDSFSMPSDIFVDDNTIYVVDSNLKTIFVYEHIYE